MESTILTCLVRGQVKYIGVNRLCLGNRIIEFDSTGQATRIIDKPTEGASLVIQLRAADLDKGLAYQYALVIANDPDPSMSLSLNVPATTDPQQLIRLNPPLLKAPLLGQVVGVLPRENPTDEWRKTLYAYLGLDERLHPDSGTEDYIPVNPADIRQDEAVWVDPEGGYWIAAEIFPTADTNRRKLELTK